MTPSELEKLRADTPGVANRIHLDNAGAALMPRPVIEAIKSHIDLEAAIGGYEAADARREEMAAVYESIARLIGASHSEIALIENATLAWDMAFYSIPFAKGDRILTTRVEYGANYVAYLQVARRTGAVIEVIPNNDQGESDPQALEAMIDERVKLIAVTWIPTNGGLINPAQEIGRIARRHNILYLLDACQAAGHIPIDVKALGCDMLSSTGRKFLRGPRGTGFLYVKQSVLERLEPAMIDHHAGEWVAPDAYRLRSDARRFETWENAYALHLGLGAAVDYALAIGLEPIRNRSFALARMLRGALAEIPGVSIHDLGSNPGAIVTFTVDGVAIADIKTKLAEKRINVGQSIPSSTLLDALARNLPPVVRASPHYYNSEEDIGALVDCVREIAKAS
ncbi:MAG: aminotransferase class V-fold PLP-dependent enzyme [Parvibaculaceae bacterium]